MRRLFVAVLLAIALAACGVPGDSSPRAIEAKNVPGELMDPADEVTTTTQPSAFTETTRIPVYLVTSDDQLQFVRRQVTAPSSPAKAIESLLAGPSEDEADRFYTAITSETELLDVEGPDSDGLVTVNLSRNLLDITGRQQILALGQVVLTLTSVPAVRQVLFEFDGEPAEVPDASGTLTASPLNKQSYIDLLRG